MSRILSELLGANEPHFSLSLRQLEQKNGRPNADIHLTTEIHRGVKYKLRSLGLDPENTTGEELYAVLIQRLEVDNSRLERCLQASAPDKNSKDSEPDYLEAAAHALERLPLPKSCFAIKNTVTKSILKEIPPKKVMKQLGYRSLDSMLKHESAASLIAFGRLIESPTWQHNLIARYRKLRPMDFETRDMAVIYDGSKRWQKLSNDIVNDRHQNVIAAAELGTVIILPLPERRPPVATLTTLVLALHAMNEIRAISTYLKLCQVKPDFTSALQTVIDTEPSLQTHMLDRPIAWQVVQRFYSRLSRELRAAAFEPHIQPEDLSWHSIEKVLAHLEPNLGFWRHTTSLGLVHGRQAVSLNIIDVALNTCNRLPYEQRIVHYFRHSLWHELALRYLRQDAIEQAVASELHTELVNEPILI